ncbi:MAG: TetR/AcrR family transcriptional regulator [Paludibacter sp.]|nr:TetR/AcrR family transcriptional regulator [Paludibacter sp.]
MEETIFENAERLFFEKGFALTSTVEIAQASGCNQALVHYYFRTKENLFNTIFEKKFKQFFQYTFDLYTQTEFTFAEKLENLIRSHFNLIVKMPRLPYLIISEFTRAPERLKALREKLGDSLGQMFLALEKELQAEVEAGRVRPISAFDLLISIVSLNITLFVLLPIGTQLLDLDEQKVQQLLEHRREEHVSFVLNSILIQKAP